MIKHKYGSVVLPTIPMVDGYDYAAICKLGTSHGFQTYALMLHTQPFFVYNGTVGMVTEGSWLIYQALSEGTKWVPYSLSVPDGTSITGLYTSSAHVWCNEDIWTLVTSGESTVGLTGSTPVEVVAANEPATSHFYYQSLVYQGRRTVMWCDATVDDGGTLSYRWVKNGSVIAGETDYCYYPDTSTLGATKYTCYVINTLNGTSTSLTSGTVTVTVIALPEWRPDPFSLINGWIMGRRVAALRGGGGGESDRVRAYLYNGVKLPELPEWDRVAYPYVGITHVVGTSRYRLSVVSADAYYFRGASGNLFFGGTNDAPVPGCSWTYTADIGDWELVGEHDNWNLSVEGTTVITAHNPIWSNFNMEYEGTLYMEASDPVPLCNYNGMELPELPEWDTTEYPYACIAKLRQGSYIFGASKTAVLIGYKEGTGMRCDWEPPSLQSSFVPPFELNGNMYGNNGWPNLRYEEETCGGGYFSDIAMWANYDIEYNGEVIVTASEPVPVYI